MFVCTYSYLNFVTSTDYAKIQRILQEGKDELDDFIDDGDISLSTDESDGDSVVMYVVHFFVLLVICLVLVVRYIFLLLITLQ